MSMHTNRSNNMKVPIRAAPPPPQPSKSSDPFDPWGQDRSKNNLGSWTSKSDTWDPWSQPSEKKCTDPWSVASIAKTDGKGKGKKKPPPRPPPPKFSTTDNVLLIDWNSPPSSPPNTRSNSDALSVNSFGSTSNVESGFEDDPELCVTNNQQQAASNDKFVIKSQPVYAAMKPPRPPTLPTIIRPNPPLVNKSSSSASSSSATVINELSEIFGKMPVTDVFKDERSESPPMPNFPPPAPPAEFYNTLPQKREEEPYAVALFDYEAAATSDLTFRAGDRLGLIRRIDKNWLIGRGPNSSTSEGTIPANFVRIAVPLPGEESNQMCATALHRFRPETWQDLALEPGLRVYLLGRINAHWLYGQTDSGLRGQFPAAFVDHVPDHLPPWTE